MERPGFYAARLHGHCRMARVGDVSGLLPAWRGRGAGLGRFEKWRNCAGHRGRAALAGHYEARTGPAGSRPRRTERARRLEIAGWWIRSLDEPAESVDARARFAADRFPAPL